MKLRNFFSRNKKSVAGFTLVESLVALTIFALASVVISAIFLNANNLQSQTAVYQKLQNDGRYILEKLAREIRGRQIEYPLANPLATSLDFKADEADDQLSISWQQVSGRGQLLYSLYHAGAVEPYTEYDFINASDVEVVSANFYVLPIIENVWGEEPATKTQPRVTISLKLRNIETNPGRQQTLILQTTVSSKVYQ